jgi:hypothetical protein
MPTTKLQPPLSFRNFKSLQMKSPFVVIEIKMERIQLPWPALKTAETWRSLVRWLKSPITFGGKVHIRENWGKLMSAIPAIGGKLHIQENSGRLISGILGIGGKVHIRENSGKLISAIRVKSRPYMIRFLHLSLLSLSELGALLCAKTRPYETEMRRQKLNNWLLKRFPISAARPAAAK